MCKPTPKLCIKNLGLIKLLDLRYCHYPQVLPFEDADIVAKANNLFAAGGALYKTLGKKDIQETTQLMSALASAINEQRNSSLGSNMTQNFLKVEIKTLSVSQFVVIIYYGL